MKLMFASDIHGAEESCRRMCAAFEKETADRLVLLGDLLYHGPRNNLPADYAPKAVIETLNGIKSRILAVRGNCDSEVDQMMLGFPIRADYALFYIDGISLFVTHGHLYGADEMPWNDPSGVYIQGHTHINRIGKTNGILQLNPGSIGLPKDGTQGTYMIYENGVFTVRMLSGMEVIAAAEIGR